MMIPQLSTDPADKLGSLGTPTAEFTGSVHRPRDMVKGEVITLMTASGLITASSFSSSL